MIDDQHELKDEKMEGHVESEIYELASWILRNLKESEDTEHRVSTT